MYLYVIKGGEGSLSIMTKIKDLVFQEPQNKNESPKIVVVLRMSVLIFMLYLLLVCVGFLVSARYHLAVIGAIFLILYVYVFRCTYQDKMRFSYIMLNITTVLWVGSFYVLFGSDTGVHHFIFALIVVDLFMERRHPVRTLVILYLIRVFLYLHGQYIQVTDIAWLPGQLRMYMYLVSIVLEGAMIMFTGVYFTKDAFQMENRLQEYNKELRHIASTDPLTKLWNRFCMLDHVNRCLKRYNRGEMQFMSVAIGDIDHFKRINDTYGHECGDEVLRKLTELFRQHMNGVGAVARWGGEEFLFLFENMNGDDAWNELSKLQLRINRLEIPYEDQIIHVTMTLGLTEYNPHISTDANIKEADDKLYKGKESGRNRIVY
mgnify:FL=1